uniref:Kinesin motor domain-containing protein n=1 Tax=Rhizophora mucronata TaxID=61149 RepID=A0A2P2Q8C1_RHIMU
MTPNRSHYDSMYSSPRGYGSRTPVGFGAEELIAEPMDAPRNGDSISVTIRFRPLSEREFHRGDEIAWYADGDKIVRNEYNPTTAYAFDRVFEPHTTTPDVYEVAAKPVVKAAMEGINGMSSGRVFSFLVYFSA